jgi:hypothetical protein
MSDGKHNWRSTAHEPFFTLESERGRFPLALARRQAWHSEAILISEQNTEGVQRAYEGLNAVLDRC